MVICSPVHAGTPIESWIPPGEVRFEKSTELSPQEFCSGLKAKATVRCSVVKFPDGKVFIVIDAAGIPNRETPSVATNSFEVCDEEFVSGSEERINNYLDAFNGESTEIVNERIVSADGEMQEFAFRHRSKLLDHLGIENCAKARRGAAYLIK
ncbi:MAG: hypothetical protein ABL931_03515 [Usitatibacteraceae bacterium]